MEADRRLYRAEQLLREVACLYGDVDGAIEDLAEEAAEAVLKLRVDHADHIDAEHGHELRESAL